jgi:aquaporin Z
MINEKHTIVNTREAVASPPRDRETPSAARIFHDPHLLWRRLLGEFIGTFLLVLVAAGAQVMGTKYPGLVPLQSAAGAVAMMVLVLILALGRISGAHFNAVVTIGFALRHVFPWRRVPSYLVAQLLGSITAALVLKVLFGNVANMGTLQPANGVDDGAILIWEAVLTFGLMTTILAVVNGGMNVGHMAAFAIAAYFGSSILWAGPIGFSLNPTRQLGPALVSGDFAHVWAYMVGPFVGMLLAVGVAFLLRGPGGQDTQGPMLAQGDIEAVLRATKAISDLDSIQQ